jgi:hypothetical protein
LDGARGIAESSEAVAAAGPLVAPHAEFGIDEAICESPFLAKRPPSLITLSNRRNALGLPEARIDSAHVVLPDGYALAGVRWDEIASIADVEVGSTIELASTDSIGAPFHPLIYAASDLTISNGSGSGLIFVRGNLQIHDRVQFSGIIVVRETVTIADDVHIDGALRVQGDGASIIGRARITYSSCAVTNALLKIPAAARLIGAFRAHIPAF